MKTMRSHIQYFRIRPYSLFNTACWLIIIAMWAILLLFYPSLPSTIPIHFSLLGDADKFGDKSFIWLFPSITTLLHIGLSVLSKYPHTFNYAQDINDKNVKEQYKNVIRIIDIMKIVVITIMSTILYVTLNLSK